VVEWNDIQALERELAHGDVACVLAEPALTNVGIVLPEPGYHEALRAITLKYGVLLINDETHTLCAGPGGYTGAYHLAPDILTIGKAIGGGVPCGAYGLSEAVAARVIESTVWEAADTAGVGGTLAANALSLAAMRATLGEVLTEGAFARMIALGERYEQGINATIRDFDLPWHAVRIGCRVEYLFVRERPRTGAQAAAALDHDLDTFMHLYTLNRGILLTPFHMMALMAPSLTDADVDTHTAVFRAAISELFG
jgi:glutamate-1-semialdehyde 2,1-aminomutase